MRSYAVNDLIYLQLVNLLNTTTRPRNSVAFPLTRSRPFCLRVSKTVCGTISESECSTRFKGLLIYLRCVIDASEVNGFTLSLVTKLNNILMVS